MENKLILVYLLVDIIGFFAAWTLARKHDDRIELRGIAYCFTLFAIIDFSYIAFDDMLSDSIIMTIELGMSADWFIIRSVTAALCVHALFDEYKGEVHQ